MGHVLGEVYKGWFEGGLLNMKLMRLCCKPDGYELGCVGLGLSHRINTHNYLPSLLVQLNEPFLNPLQKHFIRHLNIQQ